MQVQASLADFTIDVVNVDLVALGEQISLQIADVGQLRLLSTGDLKVFGSQQGAVPATVKEAMRYGTKFFDGLLYFMIPQARRPNVEQGVDGIAGLDGLVMETKRKLLWLAIFLMLRGSYPEAAGTQVGTNVPSFLVNICGMRISPHELSFALASFDLKKINPGWVEAIDWRGFAPEIRQRFALGLSGYRMLAPFSCYQVKADAGEEVKAAVLWVQQVCANPPDYDILSCTRSAQLIGRLKSWNKALGNLILLAFTVEQINEMVANKILFQVPVRDPRSDNWRGWVAGGALVLAKPVKI
jgi:hypothetical protein